MLAFKRAVVLAVFLVAVFLLATRSHTSTAPLRHAGNNVAPGTSDSSSSASSASSASDASDADADASSSSSSSFPPNKPEQQQPLPNLAKLSLYDKLAYQFPYDVDSKFPNAIWQTWKYTPASGDFTFREQEASWTELHPGFVHEVITDAVALKLLRLLYAAVPEVVAAYRALPLPVLRADFFRYLILLARGGIYSDIDTFALRSAVHWLPDAVPRSAVGLVVGIEADPDRPDWHDWYSRRIQFCQWTIQAKPGHPVLRDVVARITGETLRLRDAGMLADFGGQSVVEFTGPAAWTDRIFAYFNDARFFDAGGPPIDWRNFTGMETAKLVGDVVVLPITSFSPGVEQMGAKDYDDPMAFVKHDFEGTWKPESERHIGEQQ